MLFSFVLFVFESNISYKLLSHHISRDFFRFTFFAATAAFDV